MSRRVNYTYIQNLYNYTCRKDLQSTTIVPLPDRLRLYRELQRSRKKKLFKVLTENIDSLGTLDQVGENPKLEKESDGVRDAIKLVCLLCDSKCQVFDINHLRYELFCSKKFIWGKTAYDP